jgi:bifunctional non-homologous end joining protein LigD
MRFPRITESALKRRHTHFILDGEAVLLAGAAGFPDFDGLCSGKYNESVVLYAFDILMLGDDDLRPLPLLQRKQHLARLLAAPGLDLRRLLIAPRCNPF